MIATYDEMCEVCKDNLVPEYGVQESYFEDFVKWYGFVKDRDVEHPWDSVSNFDLASIVDLFDNDLKAFANEREFRDKRKHKLSIEDVQESISTQLLHLANKTEHSDIPEEKVVEYLQHLKDMLTKCNQKL